MISIAHEINITLKKYPCQRERNAPRRAPLQISNADGKDTSAGVGVIVLNDTGEKERGNQVSIFLPV
jgi:hypothetical protein